MKKYLEQIRKKTLKELEKEKIALEEEIAKLKLSEKAFPSKDTNLIYKKRKQLARLLTVISEKKQLELLKNNK